MSKFAVSLPLILSALVMATAPAVAQVADKVKSNTPIAGKASAANAAPSQSTPQRKKYEFTAAKSATPAAAAAGTLAPTDGTAHSSMPAASKDKAGCHSRGSDA